MKALRTIVATAVIVFALTTVAVAGAQKLSGPAADDATNAQPSQPVAQPAAAQPAAAGAVTLSAHQFAALLRAVGAGAQHRDVGHAGKDDQARAHQRQHADTHSAAHGGARGAVTSRHTTTQASRHHTTHATTHHATTQPTSTHDGDASGGTHDGGHDGGTHDGGHDGGGCD
jgi:hypothetical protein